MKKQLILSVITLFTIFSCSNEYKEILINQLTYNYKANQRLVYDFKNQDDSLIQLLSEHGYKKELDVRHVRNETLKKTLHLRDTLVNICGGYDRETGRILNPNEVKLVANYIFNSKEGKDLKETINRVPKFIKLYKPDAHNIANDAKDFDEFANSPFTDKTFRDLFFEDNNLIGALNVIAYLEVEIVLAENKFLNDLVIKELSEKQKTQE